MRLGNCCRKSHLSGLLRIFQEKSYAPCQRVGIIRRHEKPIRLLNKLRLCRQLESHRFPGGHRLYHGLAQALCARTEHEHIERSQDLGDIAPGPHEYQVLLHPHLSG